MPLNKRDEPAKSVWATMAYLSLKVARSADLALLASFAGSLSMRAWLDVVPRKLETKAKRQLSYTNALEPIGVPT